VDAIGLPSPLFGPVPGFLGQLVGPRTGAKGIGSKSQVLALSLGHLQVQR